MTFARLAVASLLTLSACSSVILEDQRGSSTTSSGAGGSCAADLEGDPLHCGACGHDCLGGACVAGACQPVLLAAPDGYPLEIALDGAHVYWSNTLGPTSSVAKVAKSGGDVEVLTSETTNPTGQLSACKGRVYIASHYGVVASVSEDGGPLMPLAPQGPGGNAALASPAGVLWVQGPPDTAGMESVVRSDLSGGPTVPLATGQEAPVWIAADDTHAYWADYVNDDSGKGGLRRLPLDGGPVETLLVQRALVALALDETRVYALSGGTPESSWSDAVLYALPKVGGAPVVLADHLDGASRVAVDTTHVYWTESYGSTVRRVPKQGGAVETLARVNGSPQGIAVDEEAVYWVDPVEQTVRKLAK